MTIAFTAEQRNEVMMYARDERRCLTARWASRNFGISRHHASLLLEDVLRKNEEDSLIFEVIRTKVKGVTSKDRKENPDLKRKAGENG